MDSKKRQPGDDYIGVERMTYGYKQYCANAGIDPRLYLTWCSMNWRCNNPRRKDYPHYGGRGVTVCQRWRTFANFEKDMGPHPGKGWTLDRVDNNQGYRPGNCRWASVTEQNRNRSHPLRPADVAKIRALYTGDVRRTRKGLTHQALADMFGVGKSTITNILHGNTWV